MAQGCEAALDAPPPVDVPRRNILVAAVALVNQAGEVLIASRPQGRDFAGYWEFPGGKVEAGETPAHTLMRELREELAIETRPTCYWPLGFITHPYQLPSGEDVCYLVMTYVCRVWRGTITPCEGQEVKWVPPKQLYNQNMLPSNLSLIAQMIDRV